MEPLDLPTYLAGKGIATYRAGGHEITAHCWFCPDGNPKGKGKLYINAAEGLYFCFRCEARGNVRALMQHFGDDAPDELPGHNAGSAQRALADALAYCQQQLEAREDVLTYLLSGGETEWGPGRGLSAETVLDRGYGWAGRHWSLRDHLLEKGHKREDLRNAGLLGEGDRDFFSDVVVIPYRVRGTVVALRAKKLGGKYLSSPGKDNRLYGVDDLADAEEAVITEGEFDRDALRAKLDGSPDPKVRAIAVVGMPGAHVFPQEWVQLFRNCKRVYVALDPDDTGKKAAVRVKEMLGAKGRIVELPDSLPKKDWTDLFARHGWTWRNAAELFRASSGRRLASYGEAAARWRQQRDQVGRIRLGLTGFDELIGGAVPGQVIFTLAKTGTGKTVWLCNLAYNMRSRPQLFVSLEMSTPEVYERLRRIYRFWNPTASFAEAETAFAKLRIIDENRLAENELSTLCEEFADDVGERPQVMHVDYLGYYSRSFHGSSSYERTGAAAMALKAAAKSERVLAISPHQVNRSAEDGRPLDLDDARDSGVVEETGDFVLSLFRPELAITDAGGHRGPQVPSGEVTLGVLKSRHGGAGKQFGLQMGLGSLVLADRYDLTYAQQQLIRSENIKIAGGHAYTDLYPDNVQPQLMDRHLKAVS